MTTQQVGSLVVAATSLAGVIFYPWFLNWLWPRWRRSGGQLRAILEALVAVYAIGLVDAAFWLALTMGVVLGLVPSSYAHDASYRSTFTIAAFAGLRLAFLLAAWRLSAALRWQDEPNDVVQSTPKKEGKP